jgi:hypothetical protein
VEIEAGGGVGDQMVRLGREDAAEPHGEGVPVAAGHVRATDAPDEARVRPAAGQQEPERRRDVGMVQPCLDDGRPVTADRARHPHEATGRRPAAAHAERLDRQAGRPHLTAQDALVGQADDDGGAPGLRLRPAETQQERLSPAGPEAGDHMHDGNRRTIPHECLHDPTERRNHGVH